MQPDRLFRCVVREWYAQVTGVPLIVVRAGFHPGGQVLRDTENADVGGAVIALCH
jgi:hypothetical protein